jgi:hypothetical protein
MQVSFAGRNRLKTFELPAPAKVLNYAKRATGPLSVRKRPEPLLPTNVCFGSTLIRNRYYAFGQKQAALDRDAAGKNRFGAKFPAPVEKAE